MNHLNSLILEGNVVNIVSTNSCSTVTIETTRSYKGKNGEAQKMVSCFDIECCGRLSDIVKAEAYVGRTVRVVGRLSQKRWVENGKQMSKVFCIAEHFESIKKKGE